MAARARETLQQMGVPDGFAPVRPEQQDAAFDFVTPPLLCCVHPVQVVAAMSTDLSVILASCIACYVAWHSL